MDQKSGEWGMGNFKSYATYLGRVIWENSPFLFPPIILRYLQKSGDSGNIAKLASPIRGMGNSEKLIIDYPYYCCVAGYYRYYR